MHFSTFPHLVEKIKMWMWENGSDNGFDIYNYQDSL